MFVGWMILGRTTLDIAEVPPIEEEEGDAALMKLFVV